MFPTVIQAPMAAFNDHRMVIAVCEAGGLGSLPCTARTPEEIEAEVAAVRAGTDRPFVMNFFCHRTASPDEAVLAAWKTKLLPYYRELGVDPNAPPPPRRRVDFDVSSCELVEKLRPAFVSFHFGLPDEELVLRVKATGAKVISSATTLAEARWLESGGCDAIIAQGSEAGGHRGMFLPESAVATQVGTIALVAQVVDAVRVPVIAAGGIGDARGVRAVLALGAAAAQVGTAFLLCPEALTPPAHREALRSARAETTALTNVFTGRPARSIVNRLVRELGPMALDAPEFPDASLATQPLRATGNADFMPLWSGQAPGLAREVSAREVTIALSAPPRS